MGQCLAAPLAPPIQQIATNAVSLCDVCHFPDACGALNLFSLQVCHAQPKYFDGTKTHACCSKTCAAKIQPASNVSPIQQTATNAVSLCDVCHFPDAYGTLDLFPLQVCHVKPKYFDGTKTHSCCSKTCAAKIQNKTASGGGSLARGKSSMALRAAANMCDVCCLCCLRDSVDSDAIPCSIVISGLSITMGRRLIHSVAKLAHSKQRLQEEQEGYS